MHPLEIGVVAIDDGDALAVEFAGDFVVRIVDEKLAAGHAGTDFVFDGAEDQHATARHVFAGIFPCGFGNDGGTRVADTEAVTGPPADEHEPARRTVRHVVPGDALNLAAVVRCLVIERNHDVTAGDTLRQAVLREAAQFEVDTR